MYVYNNTTRLINPGGKLPLLPGENELTPDKAKYLLTFKLDAYVKGKDPMITISDERIEQEVEDNSVAKEAERKLKAYVEEAGDKVMDATNGIPDDEGTNDLAAKIAARVGAGK